MIAVRDGAAQGRGTISLFKKDAALGQCIDIRCLGLWMATQASYPVIEVIHRNEEHIGAFGREAVDRRDQ